MSPSDRMILELSLQSCSIAEIANQTGASATYIRRLLGSPEAQAEFDQVAAEQTLRMRNLYEKSVDAIRDALESKNDTVRLNAAKEWHKITGRYGTEQTQAMSAEDLAKALLEQWKIQQLESEKVQVKVPVIQEVKRLN